MADTYFKVQATNVFGWEFTGQKPSDDFILRMAKIGVVVQYVSDENNDYKGDVLLILTQMSTSEGRNNQFTYKATRRTGRSSTVIWAETWSGEGAIIKNWDSNQKISWGRVDE